MDFSIYTQEEIHYFLKILIQLSLLTLSTSVGTFTRELLFPKENTFRENIGFSLISGFISFAIYIRFEDKFSIEYLFLMCIVLGFFTPLFKNWLRDKTIFKIFFRAFNKTSDLVTNIAEEIERELDRDEASDEVKNKELKDEKE